VDKLLGCIPAYRDPELAAEGFVRPSALYIAAVLCEEFGALGIASITHYSEADNDGCIWDSLLSFAPKYRDLGPTAQIALTVWEVREGEENPSPLGGTTIRLFSKKGRLKVGNHTLKLWLGQEGDITYPSSTPGKIPVAERGHAGHVERILKKHQRGELQPVSWLDSLSVPIAERYVASESEKVRKNGELLELVIDIPSFDLPVLYQDSIVPSSSTSKSAVGAPSVATESGAAYAKYEAEKRVMDALGVPMPGTSGSGVAVASTSKAAAAATSPEEATPSTTSIEPSTETLSRSLASGTGRLILIDDPELGKENPSEIKAQKLARSRIGRDVDFGTIRPDTLEKSKIDDVLAQPPGSRLSHDDRELLWRFRGELTKEGRALTRFLKCVDWSDSAESRQASELMTKWAKISMADALELLSPDYPIDSVRAHAVEALQSTSDEELLHFLLQLVQALRYEHDVVESRLAKFLVERATKSPSIASALYWYLCAELEDPTFAEKAAQIQTMLLAKTSSAAAAAVGTMPPTSFGSGLSTFRSISEDIIQPEVNLVARMKHLDGELRTERSADRKTEKLRNLLSSNGPCSDLTSFECPCPLDPEVRLLGIVPSGCSVFRSKVSPIRFTFKVEIPGAVAAAVAVAAVAAKATASSSVAGEEDIGEAVVDGDNILLDTPSRLASLNLGRPREEDEEEKGIERRPSSSPNAAAAATPTSSSPRSSIPPTLQTKRTSSSEATPQSNENKSPTTIAATTPAIPTASTLSLIYKSGDDLRQDQLVLQLFSLMDRLFKREHLDLRITAYQVLPTSATNGLIEFVPGSYPISQVIREHGSIHRFLSSRHTSVKEKGPYTLNPAVLNNYIRSNAGYAVMTHVLGIGDRHMDNLMLTGDGRLFHIDFGYILGRDPKFSTAPLVLSRAMVDGMGGNDSVHYREFVTLCGEAFNILRKSANLLLSLIHLMAGSAIPDIRSDPEKAMLKVQERLMLGVDDAMAAEAMEQMLAAAQAAVLPKIAEVQHRVAQGWR